VGKFRASGREYGFQLVAGAGQQAGVSDAVSERERRSCRCGGFAKFGRLHEENGPVKRGGHFSMMWRIWFGGKVRKSNERSFQVVAANPPWFRGDLECTVQVLWPVERSLAGVRALFRRVRYFLNFFRGLNKKWKRSGRGFSSAEMMSSARVRSQFWNLHLSSKESCEGPVGWPISSHENCWGLGSSVGVRGREGSYRISF